MRILLIEDDPYITKLLSHHFGNQGHHFAYFPGEVSLQSVIEHAPDVLLLDWLLPSMPGIKILEGLREKNFNVPVIMLTAKNSIEDRVQGLRTGADDYLVKPFELSELDARIASVLRRTQRTDINYADSYLNISFHDKKLSVGGVGKSISAQEWLLLEKLVTAAGPLSREQLAESVWGVVKGNSERSIDMAILRLRRAIEPDAKNPRYVISQRGIGYRFNRNATLK